jgi:hypothetical protein
MKERVRVYDQIEHLERIETLDEKWWIYWINDKSRMNKFDLMFEQIQFK